MQHIIWPSGSARAFIQLIVIFVFNGWQGNAAKAADIPTQISFQNILENRDITMGEGSAVFQDGAGFMWFGGASALFRYDGYEFRQIDLSANLENPKEKKSVKFVKDIFEDSHQKLWIATRNGLLRYDANKEKLSKIMDDPSQDIKISTADFMRIIELRSGEILGCSAAGLFVIDPITTRYSVIVPNAQKPNWLKSKRVNTAYLDANGTIWLGTEEGLEKLNWQTKTFSLYKPFNEQPNLIPENRVADVISDREGGLWLATSNGLVHFDPISLHSTRYVNDANNRFSLGGNDIWKLLLDVTGVLWIASDGGGLAAFDKTNGHFINHTFEAGRLGSLSSNQVRTVFEDKNGDLWTGNFPVGINFFDRSSAPITTYTRDIANPNSLSHSAVLAVQEDPNGNLWLGTDGGGLNFLNRQTGDFSYFKNNPNDSTTVNGNAVTALHLDGTGLLWIGAWAGGLASYNPVDKKFTRYPYEKQRKNTQRVSASTILNGASIWAIKEDAEHNLWIATHTGGISHYNRQTQLFTNYSHIENDPQSLSSNSVWNMLQDSVGNFWVGTSTGLNLLNKEDGTFSHFINDPADATSLSNSSALCLFEDSKKRLWVGTDSGLNLYHPDTKTFTVYNRDSGFTDDTIRKILEGGDGNLWVSTFNGFSSLNPETGKIKNYNRIGGRLVGGFSRSGIVSREGEIMFGGTNGLRVFKPQELTENHRIPPLALTDFKIFTDSAKIDGPDKVLTQAINNTESLRLDYTKSTFSISFSALNYRDPAKNQYAYKLEGFDQEWQDAGNQRIAKYTNLNAGQYVFKVRGSNNDGVWNEIGKSLIIIQLPPPWKTWWAYTLYAGLMAAILAGFLQNQRHKRQLIIEQNRILEVKVNERTAEVREKSKDIKAMLGNIPQGLFTVQAGGIIHSEYSQFLESIFETNNIAGRNAGDLLFDQANVGSDAVASAKASIFAIVGEDEMNFYFNQSLLPKEFDVDIGTRKKYLSLDWNPIVTDDVIDKLMVSVRDITQVKNMEDSARAQKRQLDIIAQLLNLTAEKFLVFEESATKYLDQNREAIESAANKDEKIIAFLFRNMHTIKGNCRTYGFSYLSNTVHEVESAYSALKLSDTMRWDPQSMLNDLDFVEQVLAEYTDVYRNVLGRGLNTTELRDGFWMNNAVMNKIQTYVNAGEINDLRLYISRINANSLEQNLADVIASLASIASQLDKKVPVVSIRPNKVRIKLAAQELISDIFAHILRNCVDHGLENTEERINAEKNEHGEIVIDVKVVQTELKISIRDDGRGLDISSLFAKGVQLGRWQPADRPAVTDIAELIFCAGVSTKNTISDISGRGVGMDAVKQFLAERNGTITLNLLPPFVENQRFIAFELLMTLPAELFFVEDLAL